MNQPITLRGTAHTSRAPRVARIPQSGCSAKSPAHDTSPRSLLAPAGTPPATASDLRQPNHPTAPARSAWGYLCTTSSRHNSCRIVSDHPTHGPPTRRDQPHRPNEHKPPQMFSRATPPPTRSWLLQIKLRHAHPLGAGPAISLAAAPRLAVADNTAALPNSGHSRRGTADEITGSFELLQSLPVVVELRFGWRFGTPAWHRPTFDGDTAPARCCGYATAARPGAANCAVPVLSAEVPGFSSSGSLALTLARAELALSDGGSSGRPPSGVLAVSAPTAVGLSQQSSHGWRFAGPARNRRGWRCFRATDRAAYMNTGPRTDGFRRTWVEVVSAMRKSSWG